MHETKSINQDIHPQGLRNTEVCKWDRQLIKIDKMYKKRLSLKSHQKSYLCFNLLKKNVVNGMSTRIPSNIACSKYKEIRCLTMTHHTKTNKDSMKYKLTISLTIELLGKRIEQQFL